MRGSPAARDLCAGRICQHRGILLALGRTTSAPTTAHFAALLSTVHLHNPQRAVLDVRPVLAARVPSSGVGGADGRPAGPKQLRRGLRLQDLVGLVDVPVACRWADKQQAGQVKAAGRQIGLLSRSACTSAEFECWPAALPPSLAAASTGWSVA